MATFMEYSNILYLMNIFDGQKWFHETDPVIDD